MELMLLYLIGVDSEFDGLYHSDRRLLYILDSSSLINPTIFPIPKLSKN